MQGLLPLEKLLESLNFASTDFDESNNIIDTEPSYQDYFDTPADRKVCESQQYKNKVCSFTRLR